jgi:hypothetical protein
MKRKKQALAEIFQVLGGKSRHDAAMRATAKPDIAPFPGAGYNGARA